MNRPPLDLLALSGYAPLARKESLQRYQAIIRLQRSITRTVLRWFFELEDGYIETAARGLVFDSRILDYRVDVQAVLDKLPPTEATAILLFHRDGLSQAQACTVAGIATDRPDKLFERVEAQLGHTFEVKGLSNFMVYVDHLR